MWIPRFAVNDQGEILYIKQECSVAGTWEIPEIFVYETKNVDLSLAGIWVEYNPLEDENKVNSKIEEMKKEENKYGFIANTVGVGVPDDLSIQNTIQTYITSIVGADASARQLLMNITNANRTILKIVNTNKKEPIKGKAILNKEESIITINVTYSTNPIVKIIDINNITIGENSNTAKEKFSENTVFEYIAIDNKGNMKRIELNNKNIFVIPNLKRLVEFRDRVNAGEDFAGVEVLQVADIDMSSELEWEPIGENEPYFAGIYDGMYHTISNLYLHSDKYIELGLFGVITEDAKIKNLIMKNVDVENMCDETNDTGGIAGSCKGTIERCGIESGIIKAIMQNPRKNYDGVNVGGICGAIWDTKTGLIKECYNKAEIYGEMMEPGSRKVQICVGGVAGLIINTAQIEDSYNTGNLSSVNSSYKTIGSIVGYPYSTRLTMSNCYSTVEIPMYQYKYSSTLNTSNCYYTESEVNALKTDCSKLGDAFVTDTNNINNGYPILAWELEAKK